MQSTLLKGWLLLMDDILHHLGALKYCNSEDFKHFRWCKISSINSMQGLFGGLTKDFSGLQTKAHVS